MDTPKEKANRSSLEKVLAILVPVLSIITMVTATLFLFFIKPAEPCGAIDVVGAWCNIHPTKWWDVVGLILFYIGGLWLSAILPNILIKNEILEDDASYFPALNLIALILSAGGFGLIYL